MAIRLKKLRTVVVKDRFGGPSEGIVLPSELYKGKLVIALFYMGSNNSIFGATFCFNGKDYDISPGAISTILGSINYDKLMPLRRYQELQKLMLEYRIGKLCEANRDMIVHLDLVLEDIWEFSEIGSE